MFDTMENGIAKADTQQQIEASLLANNKEIDSPLILPPKAIDVARMEPHPGVVIEKQRLIALVDRWKSLGFPEDVLLSLLSNVSFIRPQDFGMAMQEMSHAVIQYIGDKPFSICSHKVDGHSGRFLIDQVMQNISNKPRNIIEVDALEEKTDAPAVVGLDETLLFIDDASYSRGGSQLDTSLHILERRGVDPKHIGVFLVGSTGPSREVVDGRCDNLWSYFDFVSLAQALREEGYRELSKLMYKGHPLKHYPAMHPQAVLNAFYFKIPDMLVGLLQRRVFKDLPPILSNEANDPFRISPFYHDTEAH